MIIQATPYGTKKEEPFAFTYSGDFTDERVDGVGDVTLNTSGTLTVLSGKATVSVYILGAGGGGSLYMAGSWSVHVGTGGSGGYQTVTVTLEPGTYEIVIGTGGTSTKSGYVPPQAGSGGNTTAFGFTSTGGTGGRGSTTPSRGEGGAPNGNAGVAVTNLGMGGSAAGGSPNGGGVTFSTADSGGNGLVRITFS